MSQNNWNIAKYGQTHCQSYVKPTGFTNILYSCDAHPPIVYWNIFRSKTFGLLPPTVQSPTLFTGEILSISVVVTAVAFIVIGFLAGLLVMYLCSRKKAVYSPATERKVNLRPTAPAAGPVYEEVSPKEEIELNSNQAYGPVYDCKTFVNVHQLHAHVYNYCNQIPFEDRYLMPMF